MTNSNSRWVQPKLALESKTIWVNILTFVVGILLLTSQQDWLPENIGAMLLTAIGVINVILRFLTDGPIQMTSTKHIDSN